MSQYERESVLFVADMVDPRASIVQAPGMPTYELHTLGWRAFQDLCATVLREVWGQTVQSFADTNDGGRDGAFYGIWHGAALDEVVREGPFVLQCKFLARRDDTLTLSSVADELAKAEALVERGLCNSYVLMSNARVTGSSEASIRDALKERGVTHPLILAGHWVNETIAQNPRLRMFVPRVYGLGDLSQILDQRAYEQARALLDYLQEDLSTFVVTDAYRQAVKAIEDHGFCLLLGEPAVGKSVIAATLAVTALDQWEIPTVKLDGPSDIARWNPNEPRQFFWADDAFGAIRHDRTLTNDWAQRLPKVMAAVKGGSKVVMTSRDYIYRDARTLLKDYAYPLLREQQVVIDVAQLTKDERRQILYNHMRLGDQSQEFRSAVKPHLIAAAEQEPFRPEVARRLGRQSFTKGLDTTEFAVREFMAKPNQFLQDVYEGLGPDLIGALAMVYQAGDLPVPLGRPTTEHQELLQLIGSSHDHVSAALTVLEGTFLRRSRKPGTIDQQKYWVFRHPTLREGFAAFVASNPNWLEIFISGLDDEGILSQLDCGSGDRRGTLITVPSTLYPIVAERANQARMASSSLDRDAQWRVTQRWSTFLANRCSADFLRLYISVDPQLVERSMRLGSYLSSGFQLPILARLREFGLLSEENIRKIIDVIGELAVETPDTDWLRSRSAGKLLTDEERAEILARVKDELVPDLETMLDNWQLNEQGDSAEEYYEPLEEALRAYIEAFRGDGPVVSSLQDALRQTEEMRLNSTYWDDDEAPGPRLPRRRVSTSLSSTYDTVDRDVFDDVDE